MRFWDSSAVVPLLVQERTTLAIRELLALDPMMVVWWATEVECTSAIARLERDGTLTRSGVTQALARLAALASGWHEVEPGTSVRRTARRLLRVHPLRGADSLQLAAAIVAAEAQPETLELISLDERLLDAARREGFRVADPAGGRA